MGNISGVWLIGNIGREKGSLIWCTLGSYMILPFALIDFQSIHWCCVFSSILFEWKGKQWKREPPIKRPFCRLVTNLYPLKSFSGRILILKSGLI